MSFSNANPKYKQTFELVPSLHREGHVWKLKKKTWHDPGDGWLIAHDLYHHTVEDQGSLMEELMSFGVQHWLEGEGNQGRLDPLQVDEFSNSLAYVWGAALAHDLSLPKPPSSAIQPPASLLEAWRKGYEMSLLDFMMEQREQAQIDEEIYDAQTQPMQATDYFDRVAGWMAEGWCRARIRYPEPSVILDEFHALGEQLDQLRFRCSEGTLVTLEGSRDGGWSIVRTHTPKRRARHTP